MGSEGEGGLGKSEGSSKKRRGTDQGRKEERLRNRMSSRVCMCKASGLLRKKPTK